MASHRHFAFFVVIAIVLVAIHQWVAMPSGPSTSTSTHRSWSWSWKDSSFGHLWSGDDKDDDGRPQPPTPDHGLVDDSEDDDPDSDGHTSPPSSGRPAASFAAVSGKDAFSYLPAKDVLPITQLIQHAPGWTSYENIYLSNGTLYVVTNDPSKWPPIRMMISTSMEAVNSPENIQAREPTQYVMTFITPVEADSLWGDRIWEVKDWTFMTYDPPQFLSHYYHFVAETFFGFWMMYASMDPSINGHGKTVLPPPARLMYPFALEHQWRDYSRITQWFLHGVFPTLSIETKPDWEGRASMTLGTSPSSRKAFRLTNLLLSDRSASFRGQLCPGQTQRIASEAHQVVKDQLSASWWEPVRRAVLRFSDVTKEVMDLHLLWEGMWTPMMDKGTPDSVAPMAQKSMPIVISYIVRSGHRRTLIKQDHQGLTAALTTLCNAKGWELNIVFAEKLSREEQVQVAARTTIMLGIHGNGLTHLVWMPPTPVSAVIEIFTPGGFARDYEWTSRALGMRHFAIWNDTYRTYPNSPPVSYPDDFQGSNIPAHGPSIAKLIEDRIEGRI